MPEIFYGSGQMGKDNAYALDTQIVVNMTTIHEGSLKRSWTQYTPVRSISAYISMLYSINHHRLLTTNESHSSWAKRQLVEDRCITVCQDKIMLCVIIIMTQNYFILIDITVFRLIKIAGNNDIVKASIIKENHWASLFSRSFPLEFRHC